MTISRGRVGREVARLLAGSWRASPPPLLSTEVDLAAISEIIISAGTGGLAWARLRHSPLRDEPSALSFRDAYRYNALQAMLQTRRLKAVLRLLGDRGIEPVLVKGWAIARHYPEAGMRPAGDIDLCVRPEDYERAVSALDCPEGRAADVDLHLGFDKFYDRHEEETFARSRLVPLEGGEVRVLSEEDHLRYLCVHLLRHGATRALWLCDIAVAVETRGAGFDWEICLGGTRRQSDWVACAIGLAAELLDVDLAGTPFERRTLRCPQWMTQTVLAEWSRPYRMPGQVMMHLSHPLSLLRELPSHWPNPIEATVTLNGSFNGLPRLPFQLGHLASRAWWLAGQLAGRR